MSSPTTATRPALKQRFFQHKFEAFWFYRFLSLVYDSSTFLAGWGDDVRDSAIEPLDLSDPNLKVVDVGGGTGLATMVIVRSVHAKNITILDQSPHQLAKAKQKPALKDCTIIEGDAEDLPFPTDYADRYVSAGRFINASEVPLSRRKFLPSLPSLPSSDTSEVLDPDSATPDPISPLEVRSDLTCSESDPISPSSFAFCQRSKSRLLVLSG